MSRMEWVDIRTEGRIKYVRPRVRLASDDGQYTKDGEWGITAGHVVIYGDRQRLVRQLKQVTTELESYAAAEHENAATRRRTRRVRLSNVP